MHARPDSTPLDALALLEIRSIARGMRVLDALVKEAPITVVETNLVEPGKLLVLFGGGVAEVDSSFRVGKELSAEDLLDSVMIPFVDPRIWTGIAGTHAVGEPDTVGVVEGLSVAGVIEACDQSLKMADVQLCGLRLSPALGGKGYYVLHGLQHDVDEALQVGASVLDARLVRVERIGRPHPEFLQWLLRPAPFGAGRGGM